MARCGLLMAVLAVSFVAALGNYQAAPMMQAEFLCKSFSRDQQTLGVAEVFDLVMVNYHTQIPNMSTEKLKELMIYADDDHDNKLNMDECAKLIQYLNNNNGP